MGHSSPRARVEVGSGTACASDRSATARPPMRSPGGCGRRGSGAPSRGQDESAHARGMRRSSTIRAAMSLVDYLIVALVILSAIVGVVRGFLREIIALVTWVVARLVAWHFSGRLEPYLGGLLSSPHVRPWAARAILVILV